ncbi:MAG: hypothetical protein RBS39_05920 [Phycisphaerales bacterium]|nr:hypothetical protein [Phycisphaerales bacterium]
MRVACVLSMCALTHGAIAQITRPGDDAVDARPTALEVPELAPALRALLEAPYLSDDEKRELRIEHGLWTDEDLRDPARRARAAIIAGAYHDGVFSGLEESPLDALEALLRQGKPEHVIAALDGLEARDAGQDARDAAWLARATRLRAEALIDLGRPAEADAAMDGLLTRLTHERSSSADELVEGARCAMMRARIRGTGTDAQGAQAAYQSILGWISRARGELDPLSWRARLVEAELLYDKDNRPEARAAIIEAITLCPSSAECWSLLGRMFVDQFDFDRAELASRRLDELSDLPGEVNNEFHDEARASRGSLLGGLLLMRTRIKQGDADDALRVSSALDREYSLNHERVALHAAACARKFDYDAADEVLATLDQLAPGSPEGVFEVGRALADARQYAEASKYLNEAVRGAPNWSNAWAELGLLEVQAGRDLAALDALREAARLDPFNIRAGNSLKLVEELQTYERREGEHFVVRYKPGIDEALARDMLPVLERIYARVTGDSPGGIRHAPAGKTLIELMPSHAMFAVRIAGMPQVHTMAAATGPVIAMESPQVGAGFSIGTYDWPRVLQHEYTHTVTLSRTGNRLPHWFTEAAAVYLEDRPRASGTWRLLRHVVLTDTLFDLEKINLMFIRPEQPSDRAQAYAQGHWMYQYIVERWGPEAPLTLMDLYAAGERHDAALLSVTGLAPREFLEDFGDWARGELVRVGMLPPEGMPTIDVLRMREAIESAGPGEEKEAENDVLPDPRAIPKLPPIVKIPGGDLPPVTPDMVSRWLEKYPEHPDVLELSVRLALEANAGKPAPEMVPLLERYAAARPVDDLPHRLLARLALDGQLPDEPGGPTAVERAIEHLAYLDEREERSPAYASELARRYAELKRWDEAFASAERATLIAPFDPRMRELAATVAIKAGRMDDALRHIEALTIIEPDREIHRKRLEALRARMGQ